MSGLVLFNSPVWIDWFNYKRTENEPNPNRFGMKKSACGGICLFSSHIGNLRRMSHADAAIKGQGSSTIKNCLKLMSKENKASGESRSQR